MARDRRPVVFVHFDELDRIVDEKGSQGAHRVADREENAYNRVAAVVPLERGVP